MQSCVSDTYFWLIPVSSPGVSQRMVPSQYSDLSREGVPPPTTFPMSPRRRSLQSAITQVHEVLVEPGGGGVSFGFELAESGAIFVGEVVVPGEGSAFDGGDMVG